MRDDIKDVRDKTGTPMSFSSRRENSDFAEDYRKMIVAERAKLNMDELGNARGGLPKRGKGKIRGNAIYEPGTYTTPYDVLNNQSSEFTELYIDEKTAEEFKNFKQVDKDYLESQWTWWRSPVIYDFVPFKEHSTFFKYIRNLMLFFMVFFIYDSFQKGVQQRVLKNLFQAPTNELKVTLTADGNRQVAYKNLKAIVDKNGVVYEADSDSH